MTGLVVILLLAVTAFAQPGSPPEGTPRWGRSQVETVIIGKYSTELNLSPEQAEKFFPRFRQFQNQVEEIQRLQMERRMAMDQMAQDPNTDQNQVTRLLAEQTELTQRVADIKQRFLTDVATFLSPQQVSRCSILMEEIPRRVHQYIEEKRGMQPAPPAHKSRPTERQTPPRRRRTY